MPDSSRPLLVDVHTHIYPPAYMELLRKRERIPKVVKSETGDERIVLLKEEEHKGAAAKGRPVGPQYWARAEKLKFMDVHGIDQSVVSLANPWLDFLEADEAVQAAYDLNVDLQEYCAATDESEPTNFFKPLTKNRLYAFGSLPLVPGISTDKILEAIKQVQELSYLRGVVMGTKGIGKGLDDPEMEPIYEALAAAGLVVFVHPHYGIENAFGELDNGHVLPLALGFPMETTIAIARLILAGILDRHPNLKLLLAHSAGALPALSSRLASCIAHDPHVAGRLEHDFRYYLGMLWYDAVAYGPEELALVERVIARAGNYEGQEEHLAFVDRVNSRKDLVAPPGKYPGAERIMFGTDHPFFVPIAGDTDARWRSVDENLEAITSVPGFGDAEIRNVYGQNAVELFDLEV
ncbi:amidohydrolase family protein [Sporobolomyces koalae]|uniref:amidohydrolase family protein n=1 Tax=Sporobolomyces koalae TaxID=500713 RepID=UPI00317BBA76